MDKNRLNELMKTAEAHLEIAKYLDSRPPVRAVPGDAKALQEVLDRNTLCGKMVCHLLYAIIFEISIKVIWELDSGTKADQTHDIGKLYKGLEKGSQECVKEIYDDQIAKWAGVEGTMEEKKKTLGQFVQFSSFYEALEANRDTMVNFKYDTMFKGKSTLIGSAIWDGQTIWALPPGYTSFAARLFNYTEIRVAGLIAVSTV